MSDRDRASARGTSTTGGRHPLLWASGVNTEILTRFPSDKAKFVGVGSAVVTTATMAGLSAAFALRMALGLAYFFCVILGIAWGFAILGFDRWLVASLQRRKRFHQNLVIALPRIILAILIGVVISTPLVLRIFQQEIETELVDIRRENATEFEQALLTDERGLRITDLNEREKELQGEIAAGRGNVDVSRDPEVIRLQGLVDDKRVEYREAEQAVICEKEGRPECGSGRPGAGIAFEEKVEIRDRVRGELAELESQLADARESAARGAEESRGSRLQDAGRELTVLQAERDRLVADRNEALAAFKTENDKEEGLLIRIEALDRLTERRPSLGNAHLFLLLFITAIECLPILVKFFMSMAPPTKYEEAVAADEEDRLDVERRLSRQRGTKRMLDEADDYHEAQRSWEHREEALDRLARKTVEAQAGLAEEALTQWQNLERRKIRANPSRYMSGGPSPAPDGGERMRDSRFASSRAAGPGHRPGNRGPLGRFRDRFTRQDQDQMPADPRTSERWEPDRPTGPFFEQPGPSRQSPVGAVDVEDEDFDDRWLR